MSKNSILIIDDERDIRSLLSMTVERMGHDAFTAADVADGTSKLEKMSFDLCLTDLRLPDGSGLDIVDHIQANYPNIPVIVITAHGSMDIAIEAMKKGAFDFLNKPVDLVQLRSLIANALQLGDTQQNPQDDTGIVGNSPAITKLKNSIQQVSRSQAPVFIHGESGSGKELVARAIHQQSNRNQNPFIAVNCGAIPKELVESEFFGHMKGSFTGATHDKEGLFKSAEGGTLFLDEVADLPMDMQVKLLRAIQEKSIRPVGGHKEISTDIRILSATHKDLLQEIESGNFRNDLYYRINVIELNVPPLRQRKEDIKLLTNHLLTRIAKKNQASITTISESALNQLEKYDFPGNIRELENILERACALSVDDEIESIELQKQSLKASPSEPQRNQEIPESLPAASEALSSSSHQFSAEEQNLDDYLQGIEKEIILNALEKNRWNRTTTAKVLGITFRSLRYRLKKLGLDTED